MVNKVFKDLLGNTMEAYVDDMIVKSCYNKLHANKLSQVFAVFKKYNMRLNPTKCAFGVPLSKFLGNMIAHQGIETNPKKIQAILDMNLPRLSKKSNN